MTAEWVKSPPVMKVTPPFWTSVITLLVSRYHCGRSQIAETLPWAQVKLEVKWSSTVTVQLVPSAALHLFFTAEQSPLAPHKVAARSPWVRG